MLRLFAFVIALSRRGSELVVAGLLLGFCISSFAASPTTQIIVLRSSDSPAYLLAAKAMGEQLNLLAPSSKHLLAELSLQELQSQGLQSQDKGSKRLSLQLIESSDLVVTIGSAAAAYAAKNIEGLPVIASFITRSSFESIRKEAPANKSLTAVFMDQPASRLVSLSTLLRKDQSPFRITMLNQNRADGKVTTPDNDITVNSAVLLLEKNPLKQIETLMKNSDVFIVRPNNSLFNRLVAKLVLQLSIRYKTPVIGFSKNYAKAGALMSLYSSPDDIGRDTGNIIHRWLQSSGKGLPKLSVGQHYSLMVNQRIANKQGLMINAEQLQAELQRLEGASF